MTLVYLILSLRYFLKDEITIVMMGATGKAEERLFVQANYFTELTSFYPATNFIFHIVGLELSDERNGKSHKVNDKLKGTFYKNSVADFIQSYGLGNLPKDRTIFIGYNPGFGSGYDLLLTSWCLDLVTLLNAGYPIIFT
jgi:hypothetical protein